MHQARAQWHKIPPCLVSLISNREWKRVVEIRKTWFDAILIATSKVLKYLARSKLNLKTDQFLKSPSFGYKWSMKPQQVVYEDFRT